MLDLVLVSAIDAAATDEDLPPLQQAASAAGLSHAVWCWDDPSVDWSGCRLALLRSTWNYTERYVDFVAWLEATAAQTQLLNPPDLVRWNTDKRYLLALAQAGAAVIDTLVLPPGTELKIPSSAEFVLKPAIGAGSQGARRFAREQHEQAQTHLRMLHDKGLIALAQPYLDRVDHGGETALLYFDGVYSHAIRKDALLRADGQQVSGLYAPERISPRQSSAAQRAAAEQVLSALAAVRKLDAPPLYARVDLLDDAQGQPLLLELELAEPSLFFGHAPGSAARLIECVQRRL